MESDLEMLELPQEIGNTGSAAAPVVILALQALPLGGGLARRRCPRLKRAKDFLIRVSNKPFAIYLARRPAPPRPPVPKHLHRRHVH